MGRSTDAGVYVGVIVTDKVLYEAYCRSQNEDEDSEYDAEIYYEEAPYNKWVEQVIEKLNKDEESSVGAVDITNRTEYGDCESVKVCFSIWSFGSDGIYGNDYGQAMDLMSFSQMSEIVQKSSPIIGKLLNELGISEEECSRDLQIVIQVVSN
jgi:hypothetical protein